VGVGCKDLEAVVSDLTVQEKIRQVDEAAVEGNN